MNDLNQELGPQTLRDIQEIAKRLRFVIWDAEAAVEMMVAEGKGPSVASIMIKASTTSKPMPVLSFLEGEGRDAAGWLIGEILALDDQELERRHDFIQWLFPLPEPSQAQPQSPVLTMEEITAIRESSAAQENLTKAAELMSGFYQRNDHWLRYRDHNHLRITRIIRSLGLLQGKEASKQFLALIEERVEAAGNPVNSQSRAYWKWAPNTE